MARRTCVLVRSYRAGTNTDVSDVATDPAARSAKWVKKRCANNVNGNTPTAPTKRACKKPRNCWSFEFPETKYTQSSHAGCPRARKQEHRSFARNGSKQTISRVSRSAFVPLDSKIQSCPEFMPRFGKNEGLFNRNPARRIDFINTAYPCGWARNSKGEVRKSHPFTGGGLPLSRGWPPLEQSWPFRKTCLRNLSPYSGTPS